MESYDEPEIESEVTQSCPTLCYTMDCVAYQAPLSMRFSRQKYCSGLPFSFPGDLSNPGIEPESPALQADALTSEPQLRYHIKKQRRYFGNKVPSSQG